MARLDAAHGTSWPQLSGDALKTLFAFLFFSKKEFQIK